MDIHLRNAREGDLFKLKAMVCDTIAATCKNDYDPGQIDAWINALNVSFTWEGRLEEQNAWIASVGDLIIGLVSLKGNDYLDFMYVHKDYQGLGIAGKLLEKITSEAKGSDCDTLKSDVSKTARPFFESKGFKVIRENSNHIGGLVLINYRMEKQI